MASTRKRNADGEVVQNGGGHRPKIVGPASNMSPGKLNDENRSVDTDVYDVVVVGAGPAGLMLAANLVRFGIKTAIIDERPSKTSTGRADGLQPKTIETLKQMRLADNLLKRGMRIHDICFWSSTTETPLKRTGREVHYPPVVDILDPYILLVHQGMALQVAMDEKWFGIYQIGQRVANHFTDDSQRVFIAGDASHTHSPKAAQGMNTSMHDSLNLAWKLNLSVRGLAKPQLLDTYEHERRKVAQDLINFDFDHANAFHAGDPEALAQNSLKNIRFISGVGAEYTANILNQPTLPDAPLQPGPLLTPVKATRYIDANPVDLQLDIPMLGQFKMYIICLDLLQVKPFLDTFCEEIATSLGTSASALSYTKKPRTRNESDEYIRPERYLAFDNLITPALITATPKADFEIADLPQLLRQSPWTVYLDDCAVQNRDQKHCFEKWVGSMGGSECAVINVRPDGYIGHLHCWDVVKDSPQDAAGRVCGYYSSFLEI